MKTVQGISAEGPSIFLFGPFPQGTRLESVTLHCSAISIWSISKFDSPNRVMVDDEFGRGFPLMDSQLTVLLGGVRVPRLTLALDQLVTLPFHHELGAALWVGIRYNTAGGLGQGFCSVDVALPPRGAVPSRRVRGGLPGESGDKSRNPEPPSFRRP